MDCKTFLDWMKKDPADRYIDIRHAMDAHQQDCQSCRTVWKKMTDFESAIRQDRHITIPESVDVNLWAGVYPALTKSNYRKSTRPRRRHYPKIVWGFSTVAALSLLWLWMARPVPPGTTQLNPDLIVESATVNGRDAQVMTFQFEDPKVSVIWIE